MLPARFWLSLPSRCWFAYDRMPVCAVHRKNEPRGVTVHGPKRVLAGGEVVSGGRDVVSIKMAKLRGKMVIS